MFSSDYPPWDFDSPVKAPPAAIPAAQRGKIMGENAARLYAR
jgi:predicted TIM-barrel fold metal-dependent hydrolase